MRREIISRFTTMAVVFLVVSALYAGAKTTPFEVSSTIPTNGARGVAMDQVLTATFNQDVECSTVTTSTFTLESGSGKHVVKVAGGITCAGTVATFTPSSPLAANTEYTATITTGVKDTGGQKLNCNFVWSFKTGSTLTAPTVTAVTPLNKATGVGLNTLITAAFDQAMNPATIDACCFTVTEAGHPVKGTITYNTTTNIATFTPAAKLLPNTTYTVTISTCVTNLGGTEMVLKFVWTFTTGAAPDIIPPTVILTNTVSGATGVPLNQIITATFSEAMAPATIISPAVTFTLTTTSPVVSVPGTVTYAAVGDIATFTPTADLAASTEYTATISTGVTNLAGIAMLSSYSWTFTTGAATVVIPPTVVSTNPLSNATGVCINGAINVTFNEPLNPETINTGTFTVTGPALTPVLGTVTLDVTGTIATFTPTSNLASGTPYTATITTGVTDVLGDPLATAYVWSFTTGTGTCVAPVPLNSAALFGVLAGTAGVTNTGTNTVINGDLGTTATAYTSVTGFHDLTVLPYTQFSSGCIYTETTLNVGLVTGEIYTATTPPTTLNCNSEGTGPATLAGTTAYIATQAWNAALTACNTLAALPTTGPDPGAATTENLGGLTIYPGVYSSGSGAYTITGTDLTLDAQGNANAVWVFQMSTGGLTVGVSGAPRNVILANGAQAKNVFWQVYSAATINPGGGGTMQGTIIAQTGVTFSTAGSAIITTLNGRAVGLDASVTLVNTVINVPAP